MSKYLHCSGRIVVDISGQTEIYLTPVKDLSQSLQRVGFLAVLPSLLRDLGVSPDQVLARVGLPPNALNDPEALIPYAAMGSMLHVATTATGCPHLGLLIGQRVSLMSLGVIGELMRTAPSLCVALRDFVAQQFRHARGAVVYLLERQDRVVFGYAVYQRDVEAVSQIYDGAAAAAFSLVCELVGSRDLTELQATISRAQPADVAPYSDFFGVAPRFDAVHTGVIMPRAWLNRPTANPDKRLHAELQARVKDYQPAGEHDIVTQIRRAMRVGLLMGQTSGNEIAGRLSLARRTLHRRLADRGTSFQELLNEARFEASKQLLSETHLPIGDIASIVGFAETSVFTRAFSQWTSTTPSNWRRMNSGTKSF
jgi:AraC-like DNA-binding protein